MINDYADKNWKTGKMIEIISFSEEQVIFIYFGNGKIFWTFLIQKSVHIISMIIWFESLAISFCIWNWFEKSWRESLFVLVDRSSFWIFLGWIIWRTFVSSLSSSRRMLIIGCQPIQFSIRVSSWLKSIEWGWAESLANHKTVYNFHYCLSVPFVFAIWMFWTKNLEFL